MKIEVKSREYKICSMQDNSVLFSNELNNEISCSFFSVQLGKVVLARAINKQQLRALRKELNPDSIIKNDLIQVRIIGGDESHKYLESLISWLKEVGNDTNIINIIALDTCSLFHPNSFELNCYHGDIRAL
ncbi:MAG: hypothetical protein ACRCRR_00690 [Rickettsia sp.]